MIAILQKDIVLICQILVAHSWQQTVHNLELGHRQHRLIWVSLIQHWQWIFENERTILARSIHVDSRVRRERITTVCEFLFSNLNRRMIGTKSKDACAAIATREIR